MLRRLSALAFSCIVAACAAAPDDAATDDGALIDLAKTAMSKARLDRIVRDQGLTTLDRLPAALPKELLVNVTLKHGRLFEGEHGHLVETVVSQSATPSAPRVILWDERSGFSASYNGGAPGQTEPNSLDVMEFDDAAKAFHLSALEVGSGAPVWKTDGDIPEANRKCARCHGPSHRPIFSMYPDWPSFYGSENDELTDASKAVQTRELHKFKAFRKEVADRGLPRNLPLFDAANVASQLRGTRIYASYPYRPDIDTNIDAISRAFAFRPSLRLGIVMNRLVAQSAARTVTEHPNFETFGPLFLHDLLECRWDGLGASRWPRAVREKTGAMPRLVSNGQTLHYRDLLSLFDLKVEDVDIRYSYNHAGYANDDASTKVMEVGYIPGESGAYWNSYFDGSATIDELLAMQVWKRLSASPRFRDLAGLVTSPDGLVVKYSRRVDRFEFDKNFFEEMDRKGTWIPIPYPRGKLDAVHHREGYPARFQTQHQALCRTLERHLTSSTPAPPPAGACPASCVPSAFCKDHPNAASAVKVDGLPCMVAGAGGCQACQ